MGRPKKQVELQSLGVATVEEYSVEHLNEACDTLMEFLPVETQERVREAQAGLNIPLWQLILGYVMRCRDRDEVWSPHLLSMWENALPASAPRPCKNCKLMFTHKHSEAMYCCEYCAFGKVSERGHKEDCPTREYQEVA